MPVLLAPKRVSRISRHLATSVGITTSPFSGTSQVQRWGGAWWVYSFSIGPYRSSEARAFEVDINALEGIAGTFLFADPNIAKASVAGAPSINGGLQSGNLLATLGWSSSTTVLRKGDFFSVGEEAETRLYQVTADVASDAGGYAEVPIVPNLRAAPADGALIEVLSPKVHLRLTRPAPVQLVLGPKMTWTVEAIEAL